MVVNLEALLEKTQLLYPNEVENKTCPVCLEDYLQGPLRELPRKLPCGHLIGTECLSVWASSQTRVASTKCPWCRQQIIKPVQRKGAAPVEQYPRSIDLAFFLALRMKYPGYPFTWLLLEFLYVFTSTTIKRGLSAHPRLGMMLLVLGLCVGTVFNEDLGYVWMKFSKAPFEPACLRLYKDHRWAALGLSLALFWAWILIGELTSGTHGYDFSTVGWMYVNSLLELDFVVGW